MLRGNLYIPSIDAKDLYIANNYINVSPYGYKLTRKDDSDNLNKYINSFDYSLDLIELRKVAKEIYGRKDSLSFIVKDKEYSSKVINVTFKYSVKEYNRISKGIYVKNGYNFNDMELGADGYCTNEAGELVAIETDRKLDKPIPAEIIPKYFKEEYDEADETYTYKLVKEPKVVMSSKKLREWIYGNGFICNGIKYCRFKRSSGSARVGKCLFIDCRLYPEMHKSEQCGLDIHDGDELDIAAFEAYIALPTSSIIDTIEIKPENILVVDDWESVFNEVAVCTDLDDNNELITSEREMKIKNSIWDGQSLIDISLMDKYQDKGMLLLRNKFFKSCCFNTNIQQFFKDNGITELSQLNGTTIASDISEIKLITTPSSIKFFKFGDLDTWFKNIYPFFGVVKYDKNTHYFNGRLVQAHYQLLNTLQLSREEIMAIAKEGLDYVNLLNTDTDIMRYHLKFDTDYPDEVDNIMKDKNEMIYKMLGFNCGFEKTSLYYIFKRKLCQAYLKNMKRGHILIDGTYATLCGNPYEMLLQSIEKFDGTSVLKPGTVHNVRYGYNQDLLCCRSPHVTIGNILLTKNVACEELDTYFNLTNNIICINSINENILERLSGADFDSDSMIITNNDILINSAKKNYQYFKVPTRNINPPKSKRHYTSKDLYDLDYKTSNNKIGEIVNLSQELNSLLWDLIQKSGETVEEQYDYIKEIYYDVCQLDVMSNIEIDKAKKEYPIVMSRELDKIRAKYAPLLTNEDNRKSMPNFLGFIAETKDYRNDDKKHYKDYETSMDYLLNCINGKKSSKVSLKEQISLCEIFKPKDFNRNYVDKRHVNKIIKMAENVIAYRDSLYKDESLDWNTRKIYKDRATEDFLFELNRMKINSHTMYRILWQLERRKDMSVRNYMFFILFNYKNQALIDILNEYEKANVFLEESIDGNIDIYGKKYKKCTHL